LQRLRRTGDSLTVIFADMDHFKAINDRFGHDKGDMALRHAASVFRETFGSSAVLGRYGGDEFVVILGGLSGCPQAKALALGFLESVKQGIPGPGGETIPVSLSVGGIWCQRVPPQADLGKLIAAADELMYKSKTEKGGAVVFSQLKD